MSPTFAEIEAAFLADTSHCVVCEAAAREEGRLMCKPCQQALRLKKPTAVEREAQRARSFAIARARARAGGEKARAGLFWL